MIIAWIVVEAGTAMRGLPDQRIATSFSLSTTSAFWVLDLSELLEGGRDEVS